MMYGIIGLVTGLILGAIVIAIIAGGKLYQMAKDHAETLAAIEAEYERNLNYQGEKIPGMCYIGSVCSKIDRNKLALRCPEICARRSL